MIPITSRAFVLGSLSPITDSEGQELVLVRHKDSSDLTETRRETVCDLLQEERQRKEKQAKKKETKSDPPKKNETRKQASKPSTMPSTPKSLSPMSSLPYFEIKEEIDEAGKVLRSEAVNVTKQLELVTNHANDSHQESKECNTDTNDANGSDDSDFQVTASAEEIDTRTTPVSDQEYKTLSERLEQLARLEEKAEAKSSDNALSALRLQSKGWSKGFLSGKAKPLMKKSSMKAQTTTDSKPQPRNNAAAKQATLPSNPRPLATLSSGPRQQPATQATSEKKEISKKGWSKGFLNSGPSTNESPAQIERATATHEEGSKKVSFQSNMAEVKEIPRIGQTSVASLKAPTPLSTGAGPARPFDSSVFSGVVKERPIRPLVPGSQQAASNNGGQPKKKMSKFAQQRMHNS